MGKEVDTGTHTYIIHLGWATELREEDNPPIGQVHERRYEDYSKLVLHAPLDCMNHGGEICCA